MSLIFAHAELSSRFLSIDAIRFSAFQSLRQILRRKNQVISLNDCFSAKQQLPVLAKDRGAILATLTHHILFKQGIGEGRDVKVVHEFY